MFVPLGRPLLPKKLDFGLAEPVRRTNCFFLRKEKVDRGGGLVVGIQAGR